MKRVVVEPYPPGPMTLAIGGPMGVASGKGQAWRRQVRAIHGRPHLRDCDPFSVHGASLEDVWVLYNCLEHDQLPHWSLVHNGETKAVWKP